MHAAGSGGGTGECAALRRELHYFAGTMCNNRSESCANKCAVVYPVAMCVECV